jgi:hypothetical protein
VPPGCIAGRLNSSHSTTQGWSIAALASHNSAQTDDTLDSRNDSLDVLDGRQRSFLWIGAMVEHNAEIVGVKCLPWETFEPVERRDMADSGTG